jgi:hypothetical protein
MSKDAVGGAVWTVRVRARHERREITSLGRVGVNVFICERWWVVIIKEIWNRRCV